MKLPNSITGFYDNDGNQPPKVDKKKFKQLCFTIIAEHGGNIIAFHEPQYPMNFYNVHVKAFNLHFHILLNEYHPYLAFASNVEDGDICYMNLPELKKEFSSYYHVLSCEELNEPIHFKLGSQMGILLNDNELNKAELEQIVFHRPEKLGDIIFNYWD
jgi:hypothetical protein